MPNQKRVTPEQLEVLQVVAKMRDYLQARQAIRNAGITAETTFVTSAEKLTALYARSACYNPADLGKDGKLNEIQHRVNGSRVAMPWKAFNAKKSGQADQIVKIDGVTYSIEHKSSNGDFFHTAEADLETAFAKWAKNGNKFLYWDTQYFTLVIPANKLLDALSGYRLGWRTFFRLNGNIVYCQPFHTSRKKLDFLEGLAEQYSEYRDMFAGYLD